MSNPAQVVGVWQVEAPEAPFPHHMFTFHADGTMLQSNPDGGNASSSDSSGMGIWRPEGERIRGKFMEVNVDRQTRAFLGKAVIQFDLSIEGDRFEGKAEAFFYGPTGALLRGPLSTPLKGERFTF